MKVAIQYLIDGAPVELRAREGSTSRRTRAPWHRRRGWPVAIASTRMSAYLSGTEALNLPAASDDPDRGDWHEPWTWWTPTYLGPGDQPYRAELWGPDGDVAGAPGSPRLRDARPSLALIEHPSARNREPVHAATVAQAVIDLAWHAFDKGHEPPDRRATSRWLSEAGDTEARQIAHGVATHIDNARARECWLAWSAQALEGEDPFEREPPRLHPPCAGRIAKVNAVVVTAQ